MFPSHDRGLTTKVSPSNTITLDGTSQSGDLTTTTSGQTYLTIENSNNDTRTIDNIEFIGESITYAISSPWTLEQVNELQFAQSADVVYLVQKDTAPRKLTRSGDVNWILETVEFEDGPYFDLTHDTYGGAGADFTLGMAATTGTSITCTAAEDLFVETDIGRLIRFRSVDTAAWGYCKIVAYTSPTSVQVNVLRDFDVATTSKEWQLGSWSDTTGYPRAIS